MTDETITTAAQFIKFTQALDLLTSRNIRDAFFKSAPRNIRVNSDKTVDMDISFVMQAPRIQGIVEGKAAGAFDKHNNLSLEKIQEIVLECQRRTAIMPSVGDVPEAARALSTFYAQLSENVATAFDIAVNNKPLPISKEAQTGTPRRI